MMHTVGSYEAKTHLPELLERVAKGDTVTITKRGRPIARLVPLDDAERPRGTMGSVRLVAAEDAAYYSTGERWDAEPR